MTGSAVRVAVVGASGWAGSRHIAAFRDSGARVVALIDPRDSVEAVAASIGARRLHSVGELRTDEVDLVVVALPTTVQPGLCHDLISRGFRVLVEKPIGPSAESFEALAELDGTATHLMVGYTLHHHPAVAMLREWAASTEVLAVTISSAAHKDEVASWRADPREGGVLPVNGIHAIELMLSFWHSEPRVSGAAVSSRLYDSPVPELVSAQFDLIDGPTVRLLSYWSPWHATNGLNAGDWELEIDLVGVDGRRVWSANRLRCWDRGGREVTVHLPEVDLFAAQARAAIEFVETGVPVVGLERALAASRLADQLSAGRVIA